MTGLSSCHKPFQLHSSLMLCFVCMPFSCVRRDPLAINKLEYASTKRSSPLLLMNISLTLAETRYGLGKHIYDLPATTNFTESLKVRLIFNWIYSKRETDLLQAFLLRRSRLLHRRGHHQSRNPVPLSPSHPAKGLPTYHLGHHGLRDLDFPRLRHRRPLPVLAH